MLSDGVRDTAVQTVPSAGGGVPIGGSPLALEVLPDAPSAANSPALVEEKDGAQRGSKRVEAATSVGGKRVRWSCTGQGTGEEDEWAGRRGSNVGRSVMDDEAGSVSSEITDACSEITDVSLETTGQQQLPISLELATEPEAELAKWLRLLGEEGAAAAE